MWLPVTLLRQAVDYRVTLSTVVVSFISSVAVFALIYVVCIRFQVSPNQCICAVHLGLRL